MILHDTPYTDIWRIMEKEEEKVTFFIRKNEAQLAKDRRKDKNKVFYSSIYTVPDSHNSYLCWSVPTDNEKTRFYSDFILKVNDSIKGTLYFKKELLTTDFLQDEPTLICLTPHMLSRYRERVQSLYKGMNPDELVVYFNLKNANMLTRLDERKLNYNHEKYQNSSVYRINEGVLFCNERMFDLPGGKQLKVIRFATFVNPDLLSEDQKNAIPPDYKIIRLIQRILEGEK